MTSTWREGDDGRLYFERLLEGDVDDEEESRLMDMQMQERIAAVSSALAKLPPFAGTVFRGGVVDSSQLMAYLPGRFVTELGFTATSKDPAWAFSGGVQFIVNSVNGRDVSPVSQDPELGEVTFDHGTEFVALDQSTDHTTGVVEIWLTEVTPTLNPVTAEQILARMRTDVVAAKDAGRWRNRPMSPERADRFDWPLGAHVRGQVVSFADPAEMRRTLGT